MTSMNIRNIMDEPVPRMPDMLIPTPAPPIVRRPTAWSADSAVTRFRTLLRRKMNEWYNWLVDHTPEPIRRRTSVAFRFFKQKIAKIQDSLSRVRPIVPQRSETSLRGFANTFTVPAPSGVEPRAFIDNEREPLLDLWRTELESRKGIKTKFVLECVMVRTTDDGEVEAVSHFHSLTEMVLPGTDLQEMDER